MENNFKIKPWQESAFHISKQLNYFLSNQNKAYVIEGNDPVVTKMFISIYLKTLQQEMRDKQRNAKIIHSEQVVLL